jgi:arginine:ornithine antiporter / lysine permease
MLVTTFVLLGVEGASVYSRFARRREDVGRATLLGFLSVLAIFASVTMVSYGVLPRAALANTHPPSMAAVLESVVGPWGATFISIGVIISVQGAYLAWTLINAEVLHTPATTAVMPNYATPASSPAKMFGRDESHNHQQKEEQSRVHLAHHRMFDRAGSRPG